MMISQAWPSEIQLSQDKRLLSVRFDDGLSAELPAELLRVESPSAEVQGHGSGQKKPQLENEKSLSPQSKPLDNMLFVSSLMMVITQGFIHGRFSIGLPPITNT